jgi:hypothetical protein
MANAELPSGLVGDVRKIKGVELAHIAEQVDGPGSSDGGFTTLLNGCWQTTLDPGPYPNLGAGDVKPDWKAILKGDLIVGVKFLRQISLTDGDVFDFDAQCEECRSKIPWSVKLSELPIRKLSPESRERLKSHKPFDITIYKDGQGFPATFNLATLAQEEPVARLMKQTKRSQATIIDTICGQIVAIQGVNPDIKARWRFLSELGMGELQDLRGAMDELDCGLETAIEVRCQNKQCQWEQEVNLPLLGRRFFAPKKRSKAKAEDSDPQPDGTGEDSFAAFPATGGVSSSTT